MLYHPEFIRQEADARLRKAHDAAHRQKPARPSKAEPVSPLQAAVLGCSLSSVSWAVYRQTFFF